MEEIIKWLLEGEPWIQYRTRLDLLDQTDNDDEVLLARKAMVVHPNVTMLLEELANWPG